MYGEAPLVRFFNVVAGRVTIRVHGHLMHGPSLTYLLSERSVARAGKFLHEGVVTAEGAPALKCSVVQVPGQGWAVDVK